MKFYYVIVLFFKITNLFELHVFSMRDILKTNNNGAGDFIHKVL